MSINSIVHLYSQFLSAILPYIHVRIENRYCVNLMHIDEDWIISRIMQ
jgi:hypothetical protein